MAANGGYCRHLDVISIKIISKWRSTCDGKYQKYNTNPKNVKWMGGEIWKFPIYYMMVNVGIKPTPKT